MSHLTDEFASGRTILTVGLESGLVRLTEADKALRHDACNIVVNLQEIHKRFHALPSVRGKKSFSLVEVMQIAGLQKHVLNDWLDEQLIQPSLTGRAGRGVTRQFSPDDVLLVTLLGSLRRNGVPARLFRGVTDCLSGVSKQTVTIN